MASGKELQRLEQPGPVETIACSHDGKTLAAGGTDLTGRVNYGFLQIWDTTPKAKPPRRIGLPSHVQSLAFAPDDRTLASAQDMSIRFWDLARGEEIPQSEDHSAQTYSLAVCADGKTVAVGSAFEAIRLCDLATGKVIRRFPVDPDVAATYTVAFSPDGKHCSPRVWAW
jgi:WD40 repeat protein